MKKEGTLLLSDYASQVAATDVLGPSDFNPVLQGLYGEVGGIMATAKKHVREQSAFPGFRKAAEEEFGDTLWYLAAVCRRIGVPLEDVFSEAASHSDFRNVGAASDVMEGTMAYIAVPVAAPILLDTTLVRLGQTAAALLGSVPPDRAGLVAFARAYLDAMHAAKLAFSDVARGNIRKARGAFLEPEAGDLVSLDFDRNFGIEEQLPREFRISRP